MASCLTRKLTNAAAALLLPGARRRLTTPSSSLDIAPVQQLSLAERCILVDDQDRVVGDASKLDCHLVGDAGELLLHRAFSVFLFNERRELLLQRRSDEKITFPGRYTNACCSHPLYEVPEEREERAAAGVRAAAVRRLDHELGVKAQSDLMNYVTRIHYRGSEGRFGEHEIDYILVMRGDVSLNPNPDEVSEVLYVGRSQFDAWVRGDGDHPPPPLTPWFELIVRHRLLHAWWDNLDELEKLKDHDNILRYC